MRPAAYTYTDIDIDQHTPLSKQKQYILKQCLAMYEALSTNDYHKRQQILEGVSFEDQSYIIQTCKRCITYLFTTPQGRSPLFPYTTSNNAHHVSRQIIPPGSTIEKLFHDIVIAHSIGAKATQYFLHKKEPDHRSLFYTPV